MTAGQSTRGRSGPSSWAPAAGLNLLLGIAAAPAVLAGSWPLTLIPFTYIAAVTSSAAARSTAENADPPRWLWYRWEGWSPPWARLRRPRARAEGRQLAQSLRCCAFRVIPPFWRVYRDPAPAGIRQAVRTGVLSLVLVDATLAAAYAGPFFGAVVLATAVVAAGLARLFAVT